LNGANAWGNQRAARSQRCAGLPPNSRTFIIEGQHIAHRGRIATATDENIRAIGNGKRACRNDGAPLSGLPCRAKTGNGRGSGDLDIIPSLDAKVYRRRRGYAADIVLVDGIQQITANRADQLPIGTIEFDNIARPGLNSVWHQRLAALLHSLRG